MKKIYYAINENRIAALTPTGFAPNLTTLSDSYANLLFYKNHSWDFKESIFGPDMIDELGELILNGNDKGTEAFLQQNNSSLEPIYIKDKRYLRQQGTKTGYDYPFEIDHQWLAILCKEDAIAKQLLRHINVVEMKFQNLSFFEVLLVINSNLIFYYKNTHKDEILKAMYSVLFSRNITELRFKSFYRNCLTNFFHLDLHVNAVVNEQNETMLFPALRFEEYDFCAKLKKMVPILPGKMQLEKEP